jgi:hypothetical protein
MIDGKMTVGTSKKVYDLVLLLPGALVTFNVQRSTFNVQPRLPPTF